VADYVDQTFEADVEFVNAATEYDLLFPVVPLEDDPYPPSSNVLTQPVDDLADFDADEAGPPEEDRGAYGSDYAFDWDRNEFFSGVEGQPLRVSGEQAVVEWALKALRTRRGEHAIYSEGFGADLDQFIGAGFADHILASEVSQEVQSCLLQHPRIVDCSTPDVRHIGDTLYMEVRMQLDTMTEPVLLGMRV
jgi:hypothetical protein